MFWKISGAKLPGFPPDCGPGITVSGVGD